MAQPRLFETISWHETVIRSNMPVKRDCGTGVASPVSLFRAATPYLISLGRAKPPLLCHQGIQMALFGLFGKKQEQAISWPEVAGRIAGMLLTLLNTDPKGLASPYARVVLRKDGTIFLAADKRNPRQILGWGDLSFVFLRENQTALETWVDEMKAAGSPPFQQIATEEFAKTLTRVLMQSVSTSE